MGSYVFLIVSRIEIGKFGSCLKVLVFMEITKSIKLVSRRSKATLKNKVLKIGKVGSSEKSFSDYPIY